MLNYYYHNINNKSNNIYNDTNIIYNKHNAADSNLQVGCRVHATVAPTPTDAAAINYSDIATNPNAIYQNYQHHHLYDWKNYHHEQHIFTNIKTERKEDIDDDRYL